MAPCTWLLSRQELAGGVGGPVEHHPLSARPTQAPPCSRALPVNFFVYSVYIVNTEYSVFYPVVHCTWRQGGLRASSPGSVESSSHGIDRFWAGGDCSAVQCSAVPHALHSVHSVQCTLIQLCHGCSRAMFSSVVRGTVHGKCAVQCATSHLDSVLQDPPVGGRSAGHRPPITCGQIVFLPARNFVLL